MSLKLQLEEFFLTRLQVAWHSPPKSQQVDSELSFGYDVARHKSDSNRFRLTLTVRTSPKEKAPSAGYEMECQIVGLFAFVPDVPEAEMQMLIRINGCTILYGILRGQIASVTGSFVGGKFNLPTVMMDEVVQKLELERAAVKSKKAPAIAGKSASP